MSGIVLLTAGCSSGAGSETPQTATGSAGGGFPVTLPSVNGPITIDKQPQRVVLLNDQLVETAAAIGLTPIGGPKPGTPLGPWADGKIDQQNSAVYAIPPFDGIPAEKVAGYTPDLIIGSDYQVDAATYAKLKKIAPTVVLALNTDDNAEVPTWQSSALTIGKATGRADRARQVVDQVLAKIARVKRDNPQIAGKTVQLGNFLSSSEFVCTNSDSASSALFLRSLGLRLAKLPGAGSEPRVVLSKERFTDLNDVDLVIMGSSSPELAAKLAKDPIFSRLTPVRKKTADQVDLTWVTAYNIPTVLSIPALLDDLEPYLQRL
ncbi:ABC transporter substrate-binding protein [Microlunatus soli]|nr:ABC transporter substrate-binding protein [Microlunatus soli]